MCYLSLPCLEVKRVRVLGIVGSMRSGRVTETLVRTVVSEMERLDGSLGSEIIFTRDLDVHPCRVVCNPANCSANLYGCAIEDDALAVLHKIEEADAVILGAPHYFRGPPAGFHTLVERLQAMAFFYEAAGHAHDTSPTKDKPCGLVGICEYSSPQLILEYLDDFRRLLQMRPVHLDAFPYLGVGAHGEPEQDEIFLPFHRAKELAAGLVEALQ